MSFPSRRPPGHHREPNNSDPCGGPKNVNNGCQVVFPRMEPGGGLCFLCIKLQDPVNCALDKEEIRVCVLVIALLCSSLNSTQRNYVQCGECGICGTTVTDPCGTCRRAGEQPHNCTRGRIAYTT